MTIIRLPSGKLVIHSSAPFGVDEVEAISRLGTPSWLIEGMLDHDTFSQQGHQAFPGLPFYGPPGFEARVDFPVHSLSEPPAEWSPQITLLPIQGAPSFGETVLVHHPSKTLIVCDLLFNYQEAPSLWTKLLLYPALGSRHAPALSKRFRNAITDSDAFRKSIQTLFQMDFERIIVGHGQAMTANARTQARKLFERHGYLS